MRWLDDHPGPGGITTSWFGLDGVVEQTRAAAAALSTPGTRVAVSGDVAADQLAPWRRPQQGVVSCSAPDPARLQEAGLTPGGQQEGTLRVVVPEDPGVRLAGAALPPDTQHDPAPVAHPTQVLWDVRSSSGSDVDQAVDVLISTLRERALDRAAEEHWPA